MTPTDEGAPTIRSLGDESGIRIHDPIESAQFTLFTSNPVDPGPGDPTDFFFPVDRAVRFETDGLIVPKLVTLHVRDVDGEYLSTFDPSQGSELTETGPRIVQLSTAPMTLYLQTAGELTVRNHEQSVILSFGEPVPVELGVRSFYDSPAATIQVPDEPESVMTALSYFGSALQTLSPERSFGTLRGHPPALAVGDALEIPDSLDRPDSPVTIEIPPQWEYVYPVAPLAFYLGASVEPGPEPRLRCGDLDRSLAGEAGFQATVQDLFQHVFFMDCVTRTEGLYRVELHERNELEALLEDPPDFAALYDAPLGERLRRYLDLPIDRIASIRPTWHLCTDVEPEAEYVEALPHVVDELPLVRCPYTDTAPAQARPAGEVELADQPTTEAVLEEIDEFARQPDGHESDGWTPSVDTDLPLPEVVFGAPEAPTIEQEWLGEGIPLATNKATVETYKRRHERPPAEDEHISVDVVCNDPPMEGERIVEEYYGLRDFLSFDVTVHDDLTREELAEVLATSTDLLHYIGHVDERGFQCDDGMLDARTLDDVGCRAFMLNACTSYNQGQALIDAGSHGGVVTIYDVANSIATETGLTVARLLNAGFTLRSALEIAHDHHPIGHQYVVVGDGGVQLVEGESGAPIMITLRHNSGSDPALEFDYYAYPTSNFPPGAFTTPNVGDSTTRYLPFGLIDTFQPAPDDLGEFLTLERLPVEFNGQLTWSDELDLDRLGAGSDAPGVRRDRPGFR